jgi:uncharacterized protein
MAALRDNPLSETELDELDDFLASVEGGRAMNIEELDGFFSALIAGPDLVLPSEYWPQVFGGQASGLTVFDTEEEAQGILQAMMRHWNTIARTLNEGEIYYPILVEDDDGVARGNDWALGFLRGVDMRRASWRAFLDDDDQAGSIIPMFALAHENDPNPDLRYESPTPEKRDELIRYMIVGLVKIFEYFRGTRTAEAALAADKATIRATPTIGASDLCFCGSGRKYKECCRATLH